MNRLVSAAASDGSSIHGTLHDANGQPWLAGPAPALLSTEATNAVSTAELSAQKMSLDYPLCASQAAFSIVT